MGLMLIPVTEFEQDNLIYESDGKGIIYHLSELDKISREKANKNFSSFFVDEESFNDSGEVFHQIEDGAQIIRLLRAELSATDKGVSESNIKTDWLEQILDELKLLEEWMNRLDKNNRFYFAIA